MRICSIPNCTKKSFARTFCEKHLKRWQRHGDPLYEPYKPTIQERYFSGFIKGDISACWEWQKACQRQGYGVFAITSKKAIPAHRFGMELLHGKISSNFVICHRCDNPPCQNPNHLFIGTVKENSHDMVQKGRAPMTSAKLTPTMVKAIRRQLAKGISRKSLAQQYGVCRMTISRINCRDSWRHVL